MPETSLSQSCLRKPLSADEPQSCLEWQAALVLGYTREPGNKERLAVGSNSTVCC